MSAVTISKQVAELRTLFNKVASVGFVKNVDLIPDAITTIDYMLPILQDSVTFNTGEPSVETVDLTTGEKWTTMTTAGEPDITMNCATFHEEICELFLNKVANSDAQIQGLESIDYEGVGYNLEAKKVVGGLLMRSEDKEMVIYMPHVEIYSSLAVEESVPGYFNMQITPLASAGSGEQKLGAGVAIYFLKKA